MKRAEISVIILMILFGVVDFIDSFIIHLKEIAGSTNPSAFQSCQINSFLDCGVVAKSQYSHILGIPVSLIGILFAEGIILLGIVILFGFKLVQWQKTALSLVIAVALAFSYRLLFVSYFGLGVLCPYCIISNITTTLITISWFVYLYFIKVKKLED